MQILLLLFREVYYFLPYNVDNNNLSVDFNNNNNKINDNNHLNKSILNKNLNYSNPDYINNNELVHFAIWHTFRHGQSSSIRLVATRVLNLYPYLAGGTHQKLMPYSGYLNFHMFSFDRNLSNFDISLSKTEIIIIEVFPFFKIFYLSNPLEDKWNSLNFIDDLYALFARKIKVLNHPSSYDSISDFDDYINHYIYMFLLGGTLALNELHFDNELLFKGLSESSVPKNCGAIPIISSWFELLFDRYSKILNLIKSVDVVLIKHNDNTRSSSISTKGESHLSSSKNHKSWESLVDTALSILKMLLLGKIPA
ncbi:hypothetical protein H8356DRAFT_1421839 [Neocallimastix lanati (nom. inval.)]|nr:hypothetical protein H8356DRAFT_1421839 [Neocallimastix sp. JGI-2020a]